MSEKTVLVTGGAGFIGSLTCKTLRAAGYMPIVFDNLSTGHRDSVRFGPFIEGDLADGPAIDAALQQYAPRFVVHFAASAYVGESVENPMKYYYNNVCGTLNLLNAMKNANIRNIVFSSSCATYGIPSVLPINEANIQFPINPYGRSKLICEQMISDFVSAYQFNAVALRYFNAAGADPDGELHERHEPETHLIPRALMAASGAISCLDIFGTDYETRDGTCERDFVHVQDLATGHLRAIEWLKANKGHISVNLGSGKGVTVLELLNSIEKSTGKKVPVKFMPRRPGDPPSLFADASLARSLIGFDPRYSDIETIVSTAKRSFGF